MRLRRVWATQRVIEKGGAVEGIMPQEPLGESPPLPMNPQLGQYRTSSGVSHRCREDAPVRGALLCTQSVQLGVVRVSWSSSQQGKTKHIRVDKFNGSAQRLRERERCMARVETGRVCDGSEQNEGEQTTHGGDLESRGGFLSVTRPC